MRKHIARLFLSLSHCLFAYLSSIACARGTHTHNFAHAQFGFRVSLPQTCTIAASSKSLTSRNQFIIVFNSCQKHIYASASLCPFGIWFTIIFLAFFFYFPWKLLTKYNEHQQIDLKQQFSSSDELKRCVFFSSLLSVIAIWWRAYTVFRQETKSLFWHNQKTLYYFSKARKKTKKKSFLTENLFPCNK